MKSVLDSVLKEKTCKDKTLQLVGDETIGLCLLLVQQGSIVASKYFTLPKSPSLKKKVQRAIEKQYNECKDLLLKGQLTTL